MRADLYNTHYAYFRDLKMFHSGHKCAILVQYEG